jgi:hypothetical protein
MTNFCTLFNSNYLTRGLALYESLSNVCPSFHLYVVAFDNDSYFYLKNARLPNLTPISLSDFEDEKLLTIKPTRSAAEYCWTCTPSVILYCIKTFELSSCTYIDADMIFYHNPAILINEMGDQSVLLTEHRYTKEYDQSKQNGKYCVQFMCFKDDEKGMKALQWWRERCLEWCYARLEDGKFGDQKYLDDWTERFEGVHVLQHIGGGVAPWNLQQFVFFNRSNKLFISNQIDNEEQPLVFFHFHGLKFYNNEMVSCSGTLYEMDKTVKELIYFPYIQKLLSIKEKLERQYVGFNTDGAKSSSPRKLKVYTQFLKERLVLYKLGNISTAELKLTQFHQHNHFHPLKFITREHYGSINRS